MASMSSAPPRSIFSSSSSVLSSAPNSLGFGKFRYCYTRISQRNFVSCAITDATSVNWSQKNNIYIPNKVGIDIQQESDWYQLEVDFNYWTRSLRPVQWYPGHIAKTEKELKDQLKLMDVVIEVRDARIPLATSHPQGSMKLGRLAKSLAVDVNIKRRAKGLLPRPVRAGIVGYPNVSKSSLINRLLKRRMCPAAPRPGVTRHLKWVRFGKDLEFLDSPGILPMRIDDQVAAIKLAICDDIGERSYDVADVASILVQMLTRLPEVGPKVFYNRYKIEVDSNCGRVFLEKLSLHLFNGDMSHAALRVLSDFRKGKFGWIALERPPQ